MLGLWREYRSNVEKQQAVQKQYLISLCNFQNTYLSFLHTHMCVYMECYEIF